MIFRKFSKLFSSGDNTEAFPGNHYETKNDQNKKLHRFGVLDIENK